MIKIKRLAIALLVPLALAGCAEPKWAPEAEVQRAAYRAPGPTTLTLYTVLSNRNDSGAHSALMVGGSQRVIYDPAGTFYHPHLPERNDVHFGMTDAAVGFYIDYHARQTYRVVEQTIEVDPAVAEVALRRVMAAGAAPKSFCANATSGVLQGVPGFEATPRTYSPKKLMEAFAAHPGVRSRVIRDDSPPDNSGYLMAPGLLKRPAAG